MFSGTFRLAPSPGCQTPSKWKRSVSMTPTGLEDAGEARLMLDDVIQEDDDESDGTDQRTDVMGYKVLRTRMVGEVILASGIALRLSFRIGMHCAKGSYRRAQSAVALVGSLEAYISGNNVKKGFMFSSSLRCAPILKFLIRGCMEPLFILKPH